MEISVIQTSHKNYMAKKDDFDNFSGLCAGVCYMANSFADLCNEPIEKTQRRINQTKNSGHHSVYDHNYLTLYLNNIPKLLAMMINNEKMYTTSEKSGRYTIMNVSDREMVLYNKWLNIFKKIISDKYLNSNKFFTANRIEKLAQENARYLTSVLTNVSLVYTTSYRQLNILYSFLKQFLASKKNELTIKLTPYIEEMIDKLYQTGYIDETLSQDFKGRSFSIFKKEPFEEYFGSVYSTSYKTTLSSLAQAQRHRTLSYSFSLLKKREYYIPVVIRDSNELVEEWLKDLESINDLFPQARIVRAYEMGTMDNFILKLKERACSFVLLEMYQTTQKTLKKYVKNLKQRNSKLFKILNNYNKSSRCQFKDFKCTAQCGFPDGIKGIRKI